MKVNEDKYHGEFWSTIKDYPNYEVSSLGRVMNIKTGRIIKPAPLKNGYFIINLCNDKGIKSVFVHRLVAEAFILNPENLETVDHINGDKSNNSVNNLQWMTQADNVRKALNKPVSQHYKNGDYIATYASITEASRQTGIKHCGIVQCCRGNYSHAGGFIWRYV